MPTLLTRSGAVGPRHFWGSAWQISGRPVKLQIPWAGVRRREEVTLPLTEFFAREPLCLETESWRWHWLVGQGTVTQTQIDGPGEGEVGQGEKAGGGEGQSRAQGACAPHGHAPTLLRGPQHLLAGHGPGAALAEAGV